MDDIIVEWSGSRDELDDFHTYINSLYTDINFTLEWGGSQLNFLDLTITKRNEAYLFAIYRKPTYSDILIHYTSNHHLRHKMAGIRYMINRLLDVPMSRCDQKIELDNIFQIANNNNIPRKKVRKWLRTLKKEKEIKLATTLNSNTNAIWKKFTYNGKLSTILTRNIKNKIKSSGKEGKLPVNFAFNSNNTISKLLNNKDKIPILDKSGVYKLICDTCKACYIGQTGRAFKVRFKEHIHAYQNAQFGKSTFADHLLKEKHVYKNEFKILHTETKGKRMDALEIYEIYTKM